MVFATALWPRPVVYGVCFVNKASDLLTAKHNDPHTSRPSRHRLYPLSKL